MKQAALALNIPIEHLRVIKELYPDGFFANNAVKIKEVTDFYTKNKILIESTLSESMEALQKKRVANIVILQDLEIAERQKKTLNIDKVTEFMGEFGIAFGALLKSKLVNELPPRLEGLSMEERNKYCKDYYNELTSLYQNQLEEWTKHDYGAETTVS